MNTDKAAYWIAVAVLALGLNSEYRQGRFVALHRVADRAGSTLCRISTRAEQTFAVARAMIGRDESPVNNLLASSNQAEMARDRMESLREQAAYRGECIRGRVQDQIRDQVRAQADVIRAQVEMQRAQIKQIRFRTREQFKLVRTANRVRVVCQKTDARVTVSADTEADDNFQGNSD